MKRAMGMMIIIRTEPNNLILVCFTDSPSEQLSIVI